MPRNRAPLRPILLAAALLVPPLAGPGRAEAQDSAAERRHLLFSGRNWLVVDEKERIGPGPNYFDGRNASVDARGRLTLRTARRAGRWTSAHVFLTESLGYGTYELRMTLPDAGLDPKAVFGFFTWDDDPAYANREIDIELSRWGREDGPNVHFTVQPWDGYPERSSSFDLDLSSPLILRFAWSPEAARFSVESGSSSATWEFGAGSGGSAGPPGFGVPPAGREKIGLNLWLMGGQDPGAADRAIIESFSFRPPRP